jgi:hypothetical protein
MPVTFKVQLPSGSSGAMKIFTFADKLTVHELVQDIVKQANLPKETEYCLATSTYPNCIWLDDSQTIASYNLKDRV